MPTKLRQVIEFNTIADAIAADIAWQDNDKVVVGTDASKMWYDFESATTLPTNGTSVVAVSGGYLIMQGTAAGSSGSEWFTDASNTGTSTTEASGSYTTGSIRRTGTVSVSNTSNFGFNIYNYGTSGDYRVKMYSGTMAAPAQFTGYNGSSLVSLAAYDGVAGTMQAGITCMAAETWSATSRPTQWRLSTTPIGSTTPWNMLYAASTGKLGVGVYASNPTSTLTVAGSCALGAVDTSAAAYTVLDTESTILLSATAYQAVTLPSATSYNNRIITVVNNAKVTKSLASYYDLSNRPTSTMPPRATIVVQSIGGVWRQINDTSHYSIAWELNMQPAGTKLNVDGLFYVQAAASTYTLSISGINTVRSIQYKSHSITGVTSAVRSSSNTFAAVSAPLSPAVLAISVAPGTSSQVVTSIVTDTATWATYEIRYMRVSSTAVNIRVTKLIQP